MSKEALKLARDALAEIRRQTVFGTVLNITNKAIAAIDAAQSTQAVESQWLPIATATKDGTDVLAMYMHIDTQFVHNAFYVSDEDGVDAWDVGWWSYDHSEVSRIKLDGWMTPQYWMPLPPIPAQTEGSET